VPSFDIVSEINMQEVDNAMNQVQKELESRFDFKGTKSTVDLDKEQKKVKILADDELKLRAIHQILEQKMARRGIDIRSITYGKEEPATGNTIRQEISLKVGLSKEDAKKITTAIKDSKLKVQAQIQDEQVRVTGKKIDDLQDCIQMLKKNDHGLPLQFVNMRS
jgi:uncharacterized protein YajQ (UPF0234 family)